MPHEMNLYDMMIEPIEWRKDGRRRPTDGQPTTNTPRHAAPHRASQTGQKFLQKKPEGKAVKVIKAPRRGVFGVNEQDILRAIAASHTSGSATYGIDEKYGQNTRVHFYC